MLKRLKPIGTAGLPLGSDELGRDLLSRLMVGARLSLFMGITPVLLAFVIGAGIGILAGYAGGRTNTVIMRTIDVFYAFPSVLLAIALSGALGAGIFNSLVSLTIVFVPQIARWPSVTAQAQPRLRGSRPRHRRQRLHHRARACAGQCAGADLRLRHQPDRGVDDPGLRPVLPGPGREAARARMGPDAQHPAHGHLHPALGGGPARLMIFITSISFNLLSDGLRSAMDNKG
jgi:peptide/nickel transport system permease protein